MSDMGDDFRAFREYKRKQRAEEEPGRMKFAVIHLRANGWTVDEVDHQQLEVVSPAGKRFIYWPWKEYFQGETCGHGLNLLREAGK